MIFRNMDTENKSGYLFADDIENVGKPITEELLKSIPPIKDKVISGTFGTFNVKDFERISGGIK